MDAAAQEYFRAVEERFIERRGQALILSPADVARVADWHRQGIPLEAVLEAIDVHFERMARRQRPARRAVSLSYLEDEVLDAWSGARRRKLGRPSVGQSAGTGGAAVALANADEHARACQALKAASERLAGSADPRAAQLAAHVSAALEKLQGKAALFDPAAEGHDDERAEDHLRRLEKSLLQHAREILGPEEIARLERDAGATLGEKAHRMDDKARERAISQLVDRSLRERLGIPRLSLFYA